MMLNKALTVGNLGTTW